jgi:hypothetical protein
VTTPAPLPDVNFLAVPEVRKACKEVVSFLRRDALTSRVFSIIFKNRAKALATTPDDAMEMDALRKLHAAMAPAFYASAAAGEVTLTTLNAGVESRTSSKAGTTAFFTVQQFEAFGAAMFRGALKIYQQPATVQRLDAHAAAKPGMALAARACSHGLAIFSHALTEHVGYAQLRVLTERRALPEKRAEIQARLAKFREKRETAVGGIQLWRRPKALAILSSLLCTDLASKRNDAVMWPFANRLEQAFQGLDLASYERRVGGPPVDVPRVRESLKKLEKAVEEPRDGPLTVKEVFDMVRRMFQNSKRFNYQQEDEPDGDSAAPNYWHLADRAAQLAEHYIGLATLELQQNQSTFAKRSDIEARAAEQLASMSAIQREKQAKRVRREEERRAARAAQAAKAEAARKTTAPTTGESELSLVRRRILDNYLDRFAAASSQQPAHRHQVSLLSSAAAASSASASAASPGSAAVAALREARAAMQAAMEELVPEEEGWITTQPDIMASWRASSNSDSTEGVEARDPTPVPHDGSGAWAPVDVDLCVSQSKRLFLGPDAGDSGAFKAPVSAAIAGSHDGDDSPPSSSASSASSSSSSAGAADAGAASGSPSRLGQAWQVPVTKAAARALADTLAGLAELQVTRVGVSTTRDGAGREVMSQEVVVAVAFAARGQPQKLATLQMHCIQPRRVALTGATTSSVEGLSAAGRMLSQARRSPGSDRHVALPGAVMTAVTPASKGGKSVIQLALSALTADGALVLEVSHEDTAWPLSVALPSALRGCVACPEWTNALCEAAHLLPAHREPSLWVPDSDDALRVAEHAAFVARSLQARAGSDAALAWAGATIDKTAHDPLAHCVAFPVV